MKKKTQKRLQAKLPSVATVQPEEKVATVYPPLVWNHSKPYYIAISEYGYDIHQVAAAAIRLAQDRVPAKVKPSALLLYRSDTEVEPIGWEDGGPIWPEIVKPTRKAKANPSLTNPTTKLVGLTTTHTLFVERPRV